MVAICTAMRSVLLLSLAATQGYCSEFCRGDPVIVTAIKNITQALQCFGELTQDGLRLQIQNSDALTMLQSAALHREINLTREIADQEEQLKNRDETVNALSQEIVDLKSKIEVYTTKENMVNEFLQELRDLKESLKNQTNMDGILSGYITDLKNQIQEKDSKVKTLDIPACNSLDYLQKQREINSLVEAYNTDRKWSELRKGLESVLDHNSDVYKQVREIWYDNDMPLWTIGTSGYTELAALLLCAGLPASEADWYWDSLLHGAAHGGHLQLAQLLVQLGADVNARELGGWTPLMRAAFAGQLSLVEWLVQSGAATASRDDVGRTALRLATVNHQAAVKAFLQQIPH